MADLGKSVFATMKSEDKRTVTTEVLTQALDGKKYGFLNSNSRGK